MDSRDPSCAGMSCAVCTKCPKLDENLGQMEFLTFLKICFCAPVAIHTVATRSVGQLMHPLDCPRIGVDMGRISEAAGWY